MAVLQGLELGIPPMQAVQGIAVINGRCCVFGDLIPALIWKHGHKIKEWIEGEGDGRVAWCEITRGDNGEVIKRKFSVEDAKRAGLWSTEATVRKWNKWKKPEPAFEDKPNDSPWFRYQDRMLQMRARGFCARDGASDVLRGMGVREEMEDLSRTREARDITPEKPVSSMPPMKSQAALPAPANDEEDFKLSAVVMERSEEFHDHAVTEPQKPQEPRKAEPPAKAPPKEKQAPAAAPAGDKKAFDERGKLRDITRRLNSSKDHDELDKTWTAIKKEIKGSEYDSALMRKSALQAYTDASLKLKKAEAA
jgi:hypothetical protein